MTLDLIPAVTANPALGNVYLFPPLLLVCELNDTEFVCFRRRRGRLIGAVTEQMVSAPLWTSDRGKINAHNFKTKKKLINTEEHKIALHQCRILINRCFVCGLLVFFSPPFLQRWQFMLFLSGRQTVKIPNQAFFLTRSFPPTLPPKHTSTVSLSSVVVFLLISILRRPLTGQTSVWEKAAGLTA